MPRKGGVWEPPVYVGPPDEGPRAVRTDSKRPRNRAKCPTCFDLDLRYIPQPHKDPNFCSIGQAARQWISSTDLAKDSNCPSCRLLKSAFDTLVRDGELIDAPSDSEISYSIAILDRDDEKPSTNGPNKKTGTKESDGSKGLIVMMRCGAAIKGKEEDGFREEFKVELYTPFEGRFCPFVSKLPRDAD
ncbi:hypothetical protein JR316_0012840 [Psilocybe cubensis]|uniref:Uncharacterized protein n=2 Tax=Psilocybe cubensis TaxID=181762 RepID=A0ACB8GGE3_PSICU|nr:hypothetical protein JR316_0012840 [Psilocybe cubensis]KAH9474382.1 hypothetical protein JR316_0012840 [Psilocybe cubensis]